MSLVYKQQSFGPPDFHRVVQSYTAVARGIPAFVKGDACTATDADIVDIGVRETRWLFGIVMRISASLEAHDNVALDVYFRAVDVLVEFAKGSDISASEARTSTAAAALVAAKVAGMYAQYVDTLICQDGSVTKASLFERERDMLNRSGIRVGAPSSYSFLRALSESRCADETNIMTSAYHAYCATGNLALYGSHSAEEVARDAIVGEPSATRYDAVAAEWFKMRGAVVDDGVQPSLPPIPLGCSRTPPTSPGFDPDAYKFVRTLHEGTYSNVSLYRGPGGLVAVKSYSSSVKHGASADAVREAAIMQAIPPHPCVASFLGAFATVGSTHVLTRYEPTDLRSALECDTDAVDVRSTMRQIVIGMAHVHAHGVMHCDLKHSNILYDTNTGHARIADFGNARALPPARSALYDFHGTLGYRAPECLFAEPLVADFSADVWAVGVIFMSMLARRRGMFVSFPEPPSSMVEYAPCGVFRNISMLLGTPPIPQDLPSMWKDRIPAVAHVTAVDLAARLGADIVGVEAALRMLAGDPLARTTFAEVVEDPYFTL